MVLSQLAKLNESESGSATLIDREELLLRIKANANDPILFETFFCADCAEFVLKGGLTLGQSVHATQHRLAWLPTLEEIRPGESFNHIEYWLSQADLTLERRAWLAQVASTTNTLSWAWVLNSDEQVGWFTYLDEFLAQLAEAWLAALNGNNSSHLTSDQVWQGWRPTQTFGWV